MQKTNEFKQAIVLVFTDSQRDKRVFKCEFEFTVKYCLRHHEQIIDIVSFIVCDIYVTIYLLNLSRVSP